jgi:uncharacterized protein (UPF0335 family)
VSITTPAFLDLLRTLEPADVEEQETLLDIYRRALNM